MKTPFLALAGALGIVASLVAQSPSRPTPPRPDSGKVLILDNEQLLEGDVTRDGDQYRVKRAVGETSIPAVKVLHLVEDRQQALDFLRKRINLRDPDERVRLARWCMLYGLRDEALVEGEAAAKLRPNDPDLQTMVRGLKHLRTLPVANHQDKPGGSDGNHQDKPGGSEVVVVEEVPPPADFNTNAYGMFVAKVQPLLMNACGSCHAGGKGGEFKLARVFSGPNDRKGTLFNLSATLKRLSRDRAQASPLLTKALTAHGDAASPPIKSAGAPAFRTLETWVHFALAPEGSARPEPGSRTEPGDDLPEGVAISRDQPKPLPKPPRLPGVRKDADDPKAKVVKNQPEPKEEGPVVKPDAKTPPAPISFADNSKSKPLPKPPADEFDPTIFNNMGKKQ